MTGLRRDPVGLAARNPEVQTLRRLARRRSARSETGRYVIDGPRLVVEALDAGVSVDVVYVPVDAHGPDVDAVVRACEQHSVPVHGLAPGVLEQVTSTRQPQPAIALAVPAVATLDDVLAGTDPFVLVLCDVADPGNAGTLLRVGEACGVSGVIVCGDAAVDVHNPKVVRAAAGSLFRVPVVEIPEPAAALVALADRAVQTIATAVDDGVAYDAVDLRGPIAVVLGNEAHGLAPGLAASLDVRVHIPMAGRVESLNVAVAGAVLAFEAARQRRAK